MSSTKSKAPRIDGCSTDSPSPARGALQGHLEVTDDAVPSLKKNRSWFGSLKSAGQKVATQAKAAVDVFRTDQTTRPCASQLVVVSQR